MNKKVILFLLLAIFCAACSDEGRQDEKEQHVTNMPVHPGGDNEVTNKAEGLPTAEPTKEAVTTAPTEVIVENTIIPTAVPGISATPVAKAPEKKTLSDRIVVKTQKSSIEEKEIFLYIVEHDGKEGVINQFGEVVVEPIYENINWFWEGYAAVCQDKKYGYINESGNLLTGIEYDYASSFREGYAMVCQDKKYGYIDESGNLLTGIEYDHAEDFSEGLAAVMVNGLYGFIDTTGQFVIEPQYKWACSFSDGLAKVKRAEKECAEFITPDGKTVFETSYNCGDFHDGLASVGLMDRWGFYTYGYMDKTGQVVISPITGCWTKDLPLKAFSEGFGIMYIEKEDESVVKVYVNTKGEILGGYEFEEAFTFSEGLAYAERDGICGYIDKTGEYVITGVSPSSFYGGLASCRKDGKEGFIDKTGKFVIEPIYDNCYYGFWDGYTVVSQGEELICINKSGEEMWRLLPEE